MHSPLFLFRVLLHVKPTIMSNNHVVLACLVFVILAIYMRFKRRCSSMSLPPSPKAYPFIGHLLSFPTSNQHIAYRDMSEQLNSDIISFQPFGFVVVALNSIESAMDLFAKRAMIYSNPIDLPMLNDERLLGWGKETSSIRYEERWKKQRKLTQSALHLSTAKDLRTTMVKQTRASLCRLLQNPDNIASEFQWLTAANILASVYGYQPAYPSDDLVDIVKTTLSRLGEVTRPGNFDVNFIPWMKYIPSWFPGASWKRKAHKWRAEKDRMINDPFEWTKSQITEGVASPSILKNLLTELERKKKVESNEEEEAIIRWATGALFAGAEFSWSRYGTDISPPPQYLYAYYAS
ncbi:hypothetical protein FRC08_000315 [Ceratobasidium sp. 394]|nr:hypothetical protein FRC08_000315 [Ceratobasidium sp. 394]